MWPLRKENWLLLSKKKKVKTKFIYVSGWCWERQTTSLLCMQKLCLTSMLLQYLCFVILFTYWLWGLLCKACSSGCGFVGLTLFAKAAMRTPPTYRGLCRCFVMNSVLLDLLHLWTQSGVIHSLLSSLQDDVKLSQTASHDSCKFLALFWAREGRYSNTLQPFHLRE